MTIVTIIAIQQLSQSNTECKYQLEIEAENNKSHTQDISSGDAAAIIAHLNLKIEKRINGNGVEVCFYQ